MEYTKYFIDCSCSTGGNNHYWDIVTDTINKSNPNDQYFFWDTACVQKNKPEALHWANNRKGGGGTLPQCFLNKIQKNNKIHIITDGQVMSCEVDDCDRVLNHIQLKSVNCQFVDTGGQMNLSVSAPFTRNCEDYTLVVNNEELARGSTIDDIDLEKYQNNPQMFLSDYDNLYKQIAIKNMGQSNTSLRNNLLKLQKNLLSFISNNDSNIQWTAIRTLLEQNDYETSLSKLKEAIDPLDISTAKQIELSIQTLTSLCEKKSGFSFDLLKPTRLTRADVIQNVTPDSIVEELHQSSFECPIMLDHDLPMLLISHGPPILEDCDKKYIETYMNNPLFILLNEGLKDKIKKRLDHPIGTYAGINIFQNRYVKSPITRNNVSCAISLGNHHTHHKATDFSLANVFFGQKLVGLPELWLYVLYKISSEVTYLNDNKPFMDSFKTCLLNRMKNKMTNITLSGLPIEPFIKAPVDIAIWFCTVSIFTQFNRLRGLTPVYEHIIDLTNMLEYPYDTVSTNKMIKLYKIFNWMMNQENNNTQWKNVLRAQYQNSITLSDGFIVMLDGPASDNTKPSLPIHDVSLQYYIGLAQLVDKSKKSSMIDIPLNFTGESIPHYVVNYGYPVNKELLPCDPELSPSTFRPMSYDRKQKTHWKISAEKDIPLEKQISNYNYFIKYVSEHNKYPNKEDFIKYIYAKQSNKENNPLNTLPFFITRFVDDMFCNYETVLGTNFDKISAQQFIHVTSINMDKNVRISNDNSEQFL